MDPDVLNYRRLGPTLSGGGGSEVNTNAKSPNHKEQHQAALENQVVVRGLVIVVFLVCLTCGPQHPAELGG